jgi:PAS domain S-box-containing protein
MSWAQQQSMALYRRLAAINRAIVSSTDTADVLRLIVENATELLDAEFAVLLALDESRKRLHVRASHGIEAEIDRFSATVDELVPEKLRTRLNLDSKYPLSSVPILAADSLCGTLITGRDLPFTDEEVWMVSALADQAAIALRNEHLSCIESGDLVLVRREALEALRNSEQSMIGALRAAHTGVWDWSFENQSLAWSDDHYALLGLKPGQVQPSYSVWAERVHPDDLAGINKALERAAQQRRDFKGEYRVVWPNGTVRWIESRAKFTFGSDGRPLRLLGVITDITERKLAEAEFSRLASIVDSSTDAIYSKNLDGTITTWNKGAEKLYGYTAREAVGKQISLIVPLDRREELSRITGLITGGQPVEPFETVRIAKTGRRIDVSVAISPVRDGSGTIVGFSSIARDISEEKRIRDELKRSEEFNSRMLESSSDCIKILDFDGRILYMNRAGRELLGSDDPSSYINSYWTDFWKGAEREQARKTLVTARAGETGRFRGSLLNSSGERLWFDVVITQIPGANRLLAISRDTTERKQAEDALSESREHLAMALRSAAMTAFTWDMAIGDVVRLGRTAAESTQLTFEEVKNQVYEEDREKFVNSIEKALKGNGEYRSEHRVLTKDGSLRWIRDRGRFVFDDLRRPLKLFGVAADVTDQKQAENSLREQEELFRTIVQTAGEGILLLNSDRRIILANERLASMLGSEAERLRNLSIYQLCDERENDRLAALLDAADEEPSGQFEFRLRRLNDGRDVITLARISPMKSAPGVSSLCMFTDISELHAVTQALGTSEQRLRLAVEGAGIAIWDWEVDSDQLSWTGDTSSLFGMDGDAVPNSFQKLLARLHVDDREILDLSVKRSLESGEGFDMQFRIRSGDRSLCWVAGRGTVHMEEGVPRRVLGTVMDVTERKRVEEGLESLLDREQRLGTQLRQLVETSFAINSDLSLEGLLRAVTEKARTIIGADQAFTTILADESLTVGSISTKYGSWPTDVASPYAKGISSFVCRINQSVRLSHDAMLAHPAWRGRMHEEANRPPMRGFLAAPLIGRDERNFGLIQLSDKVDGEFTADDENILVQLAFVASAALENLRLFAETQREIAERKQVEEERQVLFEREQEAREAAERASRIKDEFLATVSHELRTPLTAILGWSRILLSDSPEPHTQVRALEVIERNAKAQSQLIEDLLDVSRIISGKLRFESRLMQLPTVIHAAVEVVRPTAEGRQITLVTKLDPSIDTMLGDPTRVQQIIWNLLANAVKFAPQGGRVELELERKGAEAVISVKDNGLGISPEFLPYVFERFRQADGKTTRAHGGLGLGLAIVRHLAEMHGGTVFASSEGEGKGSTFTVTFPLATATKLPESSSLSTIPATHETMRKELAGLHVHVVDDELDTVEVLRVMLTRHGAIVTTSTSAQEAIRALEEQTPDVLVSDIGMPENDGYDLIRTLRRMDEQRGRRLPAIALTAYAASEDRRRALLAGFETHIPKPIEPLELITAIVRLAHRHPVIEHALPTQKSEMTN